MVLLGAGAVSQAVGKSNFLNGRSVAGGGADYGLMSFYRFSRSASDDCKDKGDENKTIFHSRTPSLKVSLAPARGGGL